MAKQEPSESEIVIVGAGPAGLAASLRLGKAGIPHVLLEGDDFPKDKVCGDALSGKVGDVLQRIDPGLPAAVLGCDAEATGSYGMSFVSPGGRRLDVSFRLEDAAPKPPIGYVCRRIHFDRRLFDQLDRSCCDFRPLSRVSAVRQEGRSILLEGTKQGVPWQIRSSLVIGCDGYASVVGRSLTKASRSRQALSVGLRCYYRNIGAMHPRGFVELHFLRELSPGYFWIFPLPGGEANVGIGILAGEIRRRRLNLPVLLEEITRRHPVLRERFRQASRTDEPKTWSLPMGPPSVPLSGDGFMLAGDAASLVDPFTGEGIGNAMLSGCLAAEQALHAVQQRRYDGAFLSAYDAAVERDICGELRMSRTLQRLSRSSLLLNFIIRRAEKKKELRDAISSMFTDVSRRSDFRDPRFYARMLFG